MTTRIWIEPVKRPDGRNWYTDGGSYCGLVWAALMVRSSPIECTALCETCRVLMSRGIVGPFETWKPDIPYPCMRADIASTAELTVHEPDDGIVHSAKWRPLDQNAVSRSAVLAPAREDDGS